MNKHFKIHGDNIVECERLFNLIKSSLDISSINRGFTSPACMTIVLTTTTFDSLTFDFYPGFNKNTSDRWNSNIFQLLKKNGSFLNETPDALLTELTSTGEKILIAIEFCSALQAGNQAWQRSGRAYSTARTNQCPYLYIIDFVKYELDDERKRKALRFPNPAIPYSYYTASKFWKHPTVQVYFKSEEFQPIFDNTLASFDTSLFGETDVKELLYNLIYNLPTDTIFQNLIKKSLGVIQFMANTSNKSSFTKDDWASIQQNYDGNIIDFSKQNNRFSFTKKIAQKSITGHNREFATLATKYGIGIASKDLPFGLIPSQNRIDFANDLREIYPHMSFDFYQKLAIEKDLIVCMFKGFKPRGDDARPDRGILPLIAMLTSEQSEIMTFVYGETSTTTIHKLDSNILSLAKGNGLWSSIVSLSNFIILDAPSIPKNKSNENFVRLIENSENKSNALSVISDASSIIIPSIPSHYSENDVDSFIHTIFNYIIPNCFEGFCNPPGGDWSGISIINSLDIESGTEFRWLTLPRVSSNSKRPDHITLLFGLTDKPLIISTESKELARDLEPDIGPELKKYISDLLSYVPSVERSLNSNNWLIATSPICYEDFDCVSVGCFFAPTNFDLHSMYEKCKCDVFIGFEIDNSRTKCNTQIVGCTQLGIALANHLKQSIQNNHYPVNIFHIV